MKNIISIALISFTSFTHSAFANDSTPSWNEKMKGLNQALTQLLTTVNSDERYEDPKNREKIETQLRDLSQLSHELKSSDPAISLLAGHLQEDVKDAYQTFKNGHRNYARGLIRSLTQACIACHTRNQSGIQHSAFQNAPQDLKPIELANFYSATRQFDRAIEEYRKIINVTDFSQVNSWQWEDALKQAIVLSVRVKQDPKLTEAITADALKAKELPYYVKQYIGEWQKQIKAWKAAPFKGTTEKQLFTAAKDLITQAKKSQKFPADHSDDILYLRASALLFDLIQRAPQGKYIGEALFMQGICQENIGPRTFDYFPRMFYEDCIRRVPHSAIAQACYASFEQQTYLGFTGSAGTNLPESVKQKLLQLWSIALPLNQRDKMQ